MTSGHSDDEPHACFILLLSPQSLKRMYLEKNGGLLGGREEKDVLEMERANHSSNSNSSNAGSRKDSFD